MGKTKKVTAIILSAVMALTLSSCAGKTNENSSSSKASESSAAPASMMGNLVAYGPALLADVEKASGGEDIKLRGKGRLFGIYQGRKFESQGLRR